jgi:hypothetical protein
MADTVTGSPALANATNDSINSMFPVGTPKAIVMQTLGAPQGTTSSSDGTTVQNYDYMYTSYSQSFFRSRSLFVTFDKDNRVSNLSFSMSESRF